MKDLIRIMSCFSDVEMRAFRLYLNQHQKRGHNKKEALMDLLMKYPAKSVDQIRNALNRKISKQALYQLKKRLKDDLITFMMANHQVNESNQASAGRLSCYRMLYYFNVLVQRGLRQDARKLLEELELKARSFHLPDILLSVQGLRHRHFPLTTKEPEWMHTNALIDDTCEEIKLAQLQNDYLKQRLGITRSVQPRSSLYIPDTSDLYFNNRASLCYSGLSIMLESRDYIKLYRLAYRMLLRQPFFLNQVGKVNRGILFLYLSQSALCLGHLKRAREWLTNAELDFRKMKYWELHILELRFFIEIRSGNLIELPKIIKKAENAIQSSKMEALRYRWRLFEAFRAYKNGEYPHVVQLANLHTEFPSPPEWIFSLRLLELMSIQKMKDPDWLRYKLESLRKKATGQLAGGHRLFVMLKMINHNLKHGNNERLNDVEQEAQFYRDAYDPLGPEVISFFTLINTFKPAPDKAYSI